jgi:hypothetical protein
MRARKLLRANLRKYPWVIILATPKKSRKWIAFALLFIVALISLLVVLELTGILKESPTPEIVMVDTVSLNVIKPKETASVYNVAESLYEDKLESLYEDDSGGVSVNFTIFSYTYIVNHTKVVDSLSLSAYCTANTSLGFIHSVNINSSLTDNDSSVQWMEDWDFLAQAENLNVWRWDSGATSTNDSQIMAKGINQPNATFLRVAGFWIFRDKKASHSATITLETTIFNGTDYIKTVMPIQLEVLAS